MVAVTLPSMRDRGVVSPVMAWGVLAVLLVAAFAAAAMGWIPAEMNPWRT